MKINHENALKLWTERYGNNLHVYDFTNRQMFRGAYGDQNSKFGWNIHHKQPIGNGGSNDKLNLEITSIFVNKEIGDRTSFVIDDIQYQVKRIMRPEYGIFIIENGDSTERVDYNE